VIDADGDLGHNHPNSVNHDLCHNDSNRASAVGTRSICSYAGGRRHILATLLFALLLEQQPLRRYYVTVCLVIDVDATVNWAMISLIWWSAFEAHTALRSFAGGRHHGWTLRRHYAYIPVSVGLWVPSKYVKINNGALKLRTVKLLLSRA